MDRRCVLGCRGRVEEHHVAGRANDPGLTIPLCRRHNELATAWLRALGVDLDHERDRHPVEVAHARAAGFAVLLSWAVGPDPRITRALARVEDTASRALDRYVGPTPSETRPLEPPAPTGRAEGLLAHLGAAPGEDPVLAFERYCERVLEGLP